jgi:hypothetical protein
VHSVVHFLTTRTEYTLNYIRRICTACYDYTLMI